MPLKFKTTVKVSAHMVARGLDLDETLRASMAAVARLQKVSGLETPTKADVVPFARTGDGRKWLLVWTA